MTLAPPAPPITSAAASVPPPRPGARAIAIVMVVVGAVVAVGAVVGTGLSVAAALSVTTSERTVDASGVDHLSVRTGAVGITISFEDVDRAELEVTGPHGADDWTLERRGDQLTVASAAIDVGGFLARGETAALRLPTALRGLDAEIAVDAGDLTLDGGFGALSLDLGAGTAIVHANAHDFALRLDAGEADLALTGVETADVAVSAGDVTADLFGGQPRAVSVTASAADVEVTVAPGSYLLTGDATDADLVDTDLFSDATATSVIDAHVSDSDVRIRAAR